LPEDQRLGRKTVYKDVSCNKKYMKSSIITFG
jgi:hypothetical protein